MSNKVYWYVICVNNLKFRIKKIIFKDNNNLSMQEYLLTLRV